MILWATKRCTIISVLKKKPLQKQSERKKERRKNRGKSSSSNKFYGVPKIFCQFCFIAHWRHSSECSVNDKIVHIHLLLLSNKCETFGNARPITKTTTTATITSQKKNESNEGEKTESEAVRQKPFSLSRLSLLFHFCRLFYILGSFRSDCVFVSSRVFLFYSLWMVLWLWSKRCDGSKGARRRKRERHWVTEWNYLCEKVESRKRSERDKGGEQKKTVAHWQEKKCVLDSACNM